MLTPPHNFHLPDRTLAQDYLKERLTEIAGFLHPEEFAPAGEIKPQKFYLEFKNRIVGFVDRETGRLKDELRQSDNCHLILLKHTALVDAVVQTSFSTAVWFYNRNHQKNLQEKDVPIAIVAQGGYGREEMYFRSDVDMQVVSKSAAGEEVSDFLPEILNYFEYLFVHQDIFVAAGSFSHFAVGVESYEFDPRNPAALISLMEHRFVAGSAQVYNQFKSSIKTASLLHQEEILQYCKAHKTYYDTENTVFNQEPNVKKEMRRLYWALFLARIRYKLEKPNQFELIRELYDKGKLSPAAFKNMGNALNFLAKVRLFLHCSQKGAHRDVLSYEVREQVAELMGFELYPFYKKYFYGVAYPLKLYSRNLFWETISLDTKQVKNLTDHFAVNSENQIIFIDDGENHLGEKPESIFQILTWVAQKNYFLSLPVIRAIELNVDQMVPIVVSDEKRKEIWEWFHTIVEGKYFSKAIRLLHEFGLLQQGLIPEFKKLCGLLQDIYVHKFPADIHILHALDVLNRLALDKDADPFLVELYESVRDKTALKLAVLLHDIGKGTKRPGQIEEIVGARMIAPILENLGYGHQQKRVDDVAFLVEKHLAIKDLLLLDPEEDETYEMIWDLVSQDKERLKMLILLTYADRGGTKMKMSAGQIEQLKIVYQYTLQYKKRESVPNAVKLEFMNMIRLPKNLQSQLEIYNEFLCSKEKFAVEMFYKPGHASDLVICTPDQRGLLFKIATVLFFNRVNIIEAHIHTQENNVFDVFKVVGLAGSPIGFSNHFFLQKQIKEELYRIFVDHEPVSSIYKGRTLTVQKDAAKYKDRKPKIKIIGRSVSVETHDVLGTFMMETKVFSDLEMEVQRAVLHTYQETASNIFYLRPADVRQIVLGEEKFKNKIGDALRLLQNPQPALWDEPVKAG